MNSLGNVMENEQWTVQSPHQTELGKQNLTPLHPQEKREDPSVQTSHWLHGNSIPKDRHYFWPGLIALPKNTLPIQVRV
jgi:hypothetical protein